MPTLLSVTGSSCGALGLMHLAGLQLMECVISNAGKMLCDLQWRGLSGAPEASENLPEMLWASGDANQRNGLCKERQLS